MTDVPKIDPIKYLLVRKFGNRGIGLRTEGERELSPVEVAQIAEYRSYLEGLDNYHLSNLLREEETRALYDEQHFHKPSSQADYEHWARMPYWTIDDAVALSLGKAPERMRWPKLAELIERSSTAAEYGRRRELASRYVLLKQLDDPMLPAAFIVWADKVGISIPDKLRSLVDVLGEKVPDWKALYESLLVTLADKEEIFRALNAMQANLEAAQDRELATEDLNPKERGSMLAIIAGMAKQKYRYDPKKLRNDATTNIYNDVRESRLDIHLDTVRKFVSLAGKFLEDNAEPEG